MVKIKLYILNIKYYSKTLDMFRIRWDIRDYISNFHVLSLSELHIMCIILNYFLCFLFVCPVLPYKKVRQINTNFSTATYSNIFAVYNTFKKYRCIIQLTFSAVVPMDTTFNHIFKAL